MLEIEPGLLIWTIITFFLLLVVLRVVAWKPLLSALEEREATIRNALNEAQQGREEAARLLAENQRIVNEANRESLRILEQGREEAERMRASIAEQAQVESRRLVEAARREIDREKQLAVQEVKTTAAELTLIATGQLLGRSVTDDDHRRLVSEFLDHIPDRIEG
ncbi:MAG: F0F1 ATP synthase subunit B [bacterium]|nr:F0F1 ATP synthase subunit B [bacterium]